MRQRVMIAMAMACDPNILIADEPTTALDVTVQAQILALMDRLRSELDTGIILITHDLAVIAEVAHEVAVMYAGRIVEHSDVEDVFREPLHPYTACLLRSIPRIDRETDRGRLPAIEGTVPNPSEFPAGCRFHPRCPRRFEPCDKREPGNYRVGHRQVRCFLYENETDEKEGE
jgi:oligopeptide/dipeptide ABC transporter ATP-binding protein